MTSVARWSKVDPFVTPGLATTTIRRPLALSNILPGMHCLFSGNRALTIGRWFRPTLSTRELLTIGCIQWPLLEVPVKERR